MLLEPLQQIVLEVTYRCNLKCVFCYNVWKASEKPTGKEMDLEQIKKVVKRLPPTSRYVISGGEPLMRRDIFEVLDFLKPRCEIISLLTNGLLITDENAPKLADPKVRVQIPIHGLKHKHDAAMGKGGAFRRMLETVAIMKRRGVRYTTTTVISKDNIEDLDDILEFSVAMGSKYLYLIRFLPGGAGLKHRELLLSKDEVKRAYEILERKCKYYGLRGGVGVPNLPCIIDQKPYKHISFSYCFAGKCWYTIDPEGNLRICNHSPTIYGNLLKDKFSDIIKHPTLTKLSKAHIYPPECKGCQEVTECRGGCRAVAETMYGDLYGPDPLYRVMEENGGHQQWLDLRTKRSM